jgi:hypothetical protein
MLATQSCSPASRPSSGWPIASIGVAVEVRMPLPSKQTAPPRPGSRSCQSRPGAGSAVLSIGERRQADQVIAPPATGLAA